MCYYCTHLTIKIKTWQWLEALLVLLLLPGAPRMCGVGIGWSLCALPNGGPTVLRGDGWELGK